LVANTTVATPAELPVRHRKPAILEVERVERLYQNP
jgi:hypothetical protein